MENRGQPPPLVELRRFQSVYGQITLAMSKSTVCATSRRRTMCRCALSLRFGVGCAEGLQPSQSMACLVCIQGEPSGTTSDFR